MFSVVTKTHLDFDGDALATLRSCGLDVFALDNEIRNMRRLSSGRRFDLGRVRRRLRCIVLEPEITNVVDEKTKD